MESGEGDHWLPNPRAGVLNRTKQHSTVIPIISPDVLPASSGWEMLLPSCTRSFGGQRVGF